MLLLIAGAALLVGGAEAFAEHAVAAGRRLRLHAATLALLPRVGRAAGALLVVGYVAATGWLLLPAR